MQQIEGLSAGSKKRASHVIPAHPVKRAAFKVLRFLFGEAEGKLVPDWTRTWSGPWTVKLLFSKETFTHQDRCACIEWELRRIAEHLFQKGNIV